MPQPKCVFCGNNPVPHFLTWYFESANTLLAPVRKALLYNPISLALGARLAKKDTFAKLIKLFLKLRVLSFQTQATSCPVSRAQVLWEEALKRGIEFKELLLFGRNWDTYWAKKGNRTIVFSGLPRPAGFNPQVLEVLDDKLALKQKLQEHGLPVPAGKSVWSWRGARQVFRQLAKPVIVKPRSGSRGRHTTTYINTEQQLKEAFRVAKQLCFWVIVEEHLAGPVYRGTVVDYKTRGVLRGDPPQVVGDGKRTLRKLVEDFNAQLSEGIGEIKLTSLTEKFLARQSLSLAAIPSPGQKVLLSEKIGVSYGGNAVEEFTLCHSDNKELFEQAAKILQDPLIGFDFIIADIARSYKEQRCGFIEANSLPFINLHHHPQKGRPENIAQWVWVMLGW